ncbi:hypothetical protein [Mycobacterium asiaticum]|uniref:Transmembrane protein n=1 Tax=Mycobacterium asiaticum TaxID=1790 RepID=A0A1A3MZ49_MYCAS|nr:hypothetical protein [Mycobacterium asiaticum]OBK14796.1 hypothetical protein A5636_07215 [Mycobacterium asiaticum]
MNGWFNVEATGKILLFSLLAGAALPGLFALGVRLQAVGAGNADANGAPGKARPVLAAAGWAIYAVVAVVVILGVLYIARDFIAHHTHYPFLGAKPA